MSDRLLWPRQVRDGLGRGQWPVQAEVARSRRQSDEPLLHRGQQCGGVGQRGRITEVLGPQVQEERPHTGP